MEFLGTALVAFAAALLTSGWTVGGWAALQRRAIKQEMDLAGWLAEGRLKEDMTRRVEDRVALYLVGQRPKSWRFGRLSRRQHTAVAVIGLSLGVGLGIWSDITGHRQLAAVVVGVLWGLVTTWVGFEATRAARAANRARRIAEYWERE